MDNIRNTLEKLIKIEKNTSEQLKSEIQALLVDDNNLNQNLLSKNSDLKKLSTELYDHQKMEIEKTINLFKTQTFPEEKEQLEKILRKFISLGDLVADNNEVDNNEKYESNFLTDQDVDFLEQIAERVMLQNIDDATSIYKFFLLVNPFYGSAWISLAVCYQKMGFNDIAEQTYEIALKLITSNQLLQIYAAEFFIINKKTERAREILMLIKSELIKENKINSHMDIRVSQMLTYLDNLEAKNVEGF